MKTKSLLLKSVNYLFITDIYPGNFLKPKLLLFSMLLVLFTMNVQICDAVPSYARQTGMSCVVCHTVFPQLTTFGREFKLNGYTLVGSSTIEVTNDKEKNLLKILSSSPLSVMFQTSLTSLNKKLPDTQNGNISFPQQLSLFYAGLITPHIGTFIQITYAGQDGTFGMDNIDIRYSNSTQLAKKRLIYGFTLNNNPTVQDVWNSIPAWRFPYATSDVAPSPTASTLIEGALGQQVAGIGAYSYFNSLLYTEFSIYRSAQQGVEAPPGPASEGIIKGVAPYWRVALQHNWNKHYLEVGTTGMTTNLYPSGVSGQTNNYTDIGIDAQYELTFPKGIFVIHPSYYLENQKLTAYYDSSFSQNKTNLLHSYKMSGEIYFTKGFGATLGYFALMGSSDNILYQPSANDGSSAGSPNSDGYIAEIDYQPWYNIRLSLQYTYYNKYNGSATDYDGFHRNASDNNSLYLLLWFNF